MDWIALKMLAGNRLKYLAMLFGITFATLLMVQQASSFVGLMRNTASQIRDTRGADVWVMDPSVQYIDDVKPLADNDLYRVRGVPGVAWAVRFYKGLGQAQFPEGNFKQVIVLGLDDDTLVGAPPEMLVGFVDDLRRPDAAIIDSYGYHYLWPGEPLQLGRVLEMNDRRMVLVGICRASPTFQTFPLIYTKYSQAVLYAPQERRSLSFVLVRVAEGESVDEVCRRITERTGLLALSQQAFINKTILYYLRRTGLPLNFAVTVLLGFLVGSAVAGQTFYLFILDNLKHFGALKAMGITNARLVRLVLFQGAVVGVLGYCMGMGLAAIFADVLKGVSRALPPASYMAWPIPVGVAVAVAAIMTTTAFISLRRVLVLEPASVFR
jgi:putative ABC transport system permease protein